MSSCFGSSIAASELDRCGTAISSTNRVITIAKTPSVSVSMRDLLILFSTSPDNLLHSPVVDSGDYKCKMFCLISQNV